MKFSQFLFQFEILIFVGVLCFQLQGLSASGLSKAKTSAVAPNPHVLLFSKKSPEAADWADYFKYVKDNGLEVEEFPFFLSFVARNSSPARQLEFALAHLDWQQFGDLPREFRWVLTSVRGHLKDDSSVIQNEAILALRSLRVTETMSFFTGARNVSSELEYERFPNENSSVRRLARLPFLNSKHLFYFFQGLHSVLARIPSEQRTPELNQIRLDWIYFLRIFSRDMEVNELLEVISKFENMEPQSFSNHSQYDLFLNRMIRLLMKYGSRWGQYALNRQGTTYYIVQGPRKFEYEKIRELVRKWVLLSLPYAILNYDFLQRRELIQLQDLKNLSLNEEDLLYLKQRIQKRDLNADSYIVACLTWLYAKRPQSSAVPLETQQKTQESLEGATQFVTQEQVQEAKITQIAAEALATMAVSSRVAISNNILVSLPGIANQQVFETNYNEWTEAFYAIFIQRKFPLEARSVALLAGGRSLQTPEKSVPEWQRLEWQRLEVLRAHKTEADFFGMVFSVLSQKSQSHIEEKIIYAKFFKEFFSKESSKALVNKLKLEFRPALQLPWKKFSLSSTHWSHQDGNLIRLVFALDLEDTELSDYLTKLYTERRVDAAIPGATALGMLEVMKVRKPEIREELIRSLSFVQAGDTFGAFRVLLSLFPDSGTAITEILHKQRIDPEKKLIPLLTILLQMSAKNPQIVASLRAAVEMGRNSVAAQTRYQGLTIDRWVEANLEKVKTNHGGTCEKIFN